MKGARSHQRSSTSGVALIIVLALMALVMVLVLAVLSISSGQVKQERLMTESAGAEALARLPADLILAQLQRATTQGVTSSGEPVLWTSQPGMIRTFGSRVEPGETRPQPRMHYRLYSTPVMNSPTLDVAAASGQRISNLRLKRNGQAIEASRDYVVAGWASINQSVEGPPIWDLVFRHLAKGPVSLTPRNDIELRGIG